LGPKLGLRATIEYSQSIGEEECFHVQYHPETGCFSFLSHSQLYLDAIQSLRIIACKSEPKNKKKTTASHRSWDIFPLLGRSSDEERVEYVGVVNRTYIMQLQADGSGLSKDYLEKVKYILLDQLKSGECSHFLMKNQWHYLLKHDDNLGFVVIVTENFSRVLASQCIEELKEIHEKYSENDADENLQAHGLKRDQIIRKELQYLMWEFDELNENSMNEKLGPLLKMMEKNIDIIVNNIVCTEKILQATDDLEKSCGVFKKNAKKLRKECAKRWILMNAVIGGVVGCSLGGCVGWLIGGPVGAPSLASQGAQIGAAAIGFAGGSYLGYRDSSGVNIWKHHKNVKVTK